MSATQTQLPKCRPDLVIRCTGQGEYVVKLPTNGTYFQIGEVEHFLLLQLNGENSPESVCQAFTEHFGDPLSTEELDEFIDQVKPLRLFVSSGAADEEELDKAASRAKADDDDEETGSNGSGSLLFYRRRIFDPDRLLNTLEPWLRFLWAKEFFVFSALGLVAAFFVAWDSRSDLVTNFPQAMRWETAVLFWVTMITVTLLHEMAHGLTCKHYGGDVREIGVLFVFFTPCFYCNVSDAWLIPKKSHRLWVTLAGSYCDLCCWALAVFCWRVTIQHSLVNYLAFIVMSICGGRILFNFNPLMRLDGYYLLADWLEIPNLRKRSTDYWMDHVRWILWGAERPKRQERGGSILIYGGLIWFFSLIFLEVVIFGVFRFLSGRSGPLGMVFTAVLLSIACRRVFRGFFKSEVAKMVASRPKRTKVWVFGTVCVLAVMFLVPAQYLANGDFLVNPGNRVEVHAPAAGFLKYVHHGEGDQVQPETLIVELEVPDLVSQITRKQSEIQEVEATLKRLQIGPRPEEVAEQHRRIERAEAWCKLGEEDLQKARYSLEQELFRLEHQIQQSEMEYKFTVNSVNRAAKLYAARALAGEQYRSEYKRYELTASQLAQAKAAKLAREADGVRLIEAELARRQKELEDARSTLSLMEAGSRPEEIEAETAKRARLREEFQYLQELKAKLKIKSPAAGVIATPHMHERLGQLAEMGSLICVIDDVSTLKVEIAVAEEDVAGIHPGQYIDLKARALPFDTFVAKVDRIAPAALAPPGNKLNQNTVTVYCLVENKDGKLKSGMTGVARIYRGRRSMGLNLINKALRYFRTEFWW